MRKPTIDVPFVILVLAFVVSAGNLHFNWEQLSNNSIAVLIFLALLYIVMEIKTQARRR